MTAPAFGLGTFEQGGRRFAGLRVDGRVLDVSGFSDRLGATDSPVKVRGLLERWDDALDVLHELAEGDDGWIDESDLHVLAPFAPRQIYQSGANYKTHVVDLHMAHREAWTTDDPEAERAHAWEMMTERAATGTPYIFIGLPSAITGPYDDVILPAYSDKHDWELELAAVIGRHGSRVGRAGALDLVAGYTIINDLTTRDAVFRRDMKEIGTDWFRSKNAPGFLPLGPYVVPAEFVADPMNLTVHLELNGQTMQDASTSDMIFDVAALVAAVTEITPVAPGDLVLTGSPAGNGMAHGRLLRDGDVMVGTITGLGTQITHTRSDTTGR